MHDMHGMHVLSVIAALWSVQGPEGLRYVLMTTKVQRPRLHTILHYIMLQYCLLRVNGGHCQLATHQTVVLGHQTTSC